LFFDNDLYDRYVDRVRARGIDDSDRAGIMPMHNFKQARNFVTRCGTTVPAWLGREVRRPRSTMPRPASWSRPPSPPARCRSSFKRGVDRTFHFYTMNRADLVFAISHLLGIRPERWRRA
jgi:methylenetetrahydrofolate reductase (NADPH)